MGIDTSQKTIIFWQNCVSIHQYPLLTELHRAGVQIVQIVEQAVPMERAAMGWDLPLANYSVYTFADIDIQDIAKNYQSAFHVFSGFQAFKEVTRALKILYKQDPSRCYVFQEHPDLRGVIGILRRFAYFWYCYRFRKIGGILAAGSTSFFNHISFGTPVVPFPYYVYPPVNNSQKGNIGRGPVRFAYVGALIPRKNINRLCVAFAKMRCDWELTVIGMGPEESHLKVLQSSRMDCRLVHVGMMKNSEIGNVMNLVDCLVLPSKFDGYGVVLNEAALCGLRIICSILAGGSERLKSLGIQNWYFHPSSISALISCLEDVAHKGRLEDKERIQRRHAASELHPAVGARTLLEVLGSE